MSPRLKACRQIGCKGFRTDGRMAGTKFVRGKVSSHRRVERDKISTTKSVAARSPTPPIGSPARLG